MSGLHVIEIMDQQDTVKEAIMAVLTDSNNLSAKDISKKLCLTRKTVNSALYQMKTDGILQNSDDQKPLWRLRERSEGLPDHIRRNTEAAPNHTLDVSENSATNVFVVINNLTGQLVVGGEKHATTLIKEKNKTFLDESGKELSECVEIIKERLQNWYGKELLMARRSTLEDTKHSFNTENTEQDISLLKPRVKTSEIMKISFSELFPTPSVPRSTLLIEKPFYGKSTMCSKLVLAWIGVPPNFMSFFDIVLFIHLANITTSLHDEIVNLCERAGCKNNSAELIELFENLGNKVLLLLDGYDGANESTKEYVHKHICFNERQECHREELIFLRSATIFMTTRPFPICDENKEMQSTRLTSSQLTNERDIRTIPETLKQFERIMSINRPPMPRPKSAIF